MKKERKEEKKVGNIYNREEYREEKKVLIIDRNKKGKKINEQ